jgi:hypothetical protein
MQRSNPNTQSSLTGGEQRERGSSQLQGQHQQEQQNEEAALRANVKQSPQTMRMIEALKMMAQKQNAFEASVKELKTAITEQAATIKIMAEKLDALKPVDQDQEMGEPQPKANTQVDAALTELFMTIDCKSGTSGLSHLPQVLPRPIRSVRVHTVAKKESIDTEEEDDDDVARGLKPYSKFEFICNVCGKQFLPFFFLIHAQYFLAPCCLGKGFPKATSLQKHYSALHIEEKPFVCQYSGCQKRYTLNSSLQ